MSFTKPYESKNIIYNANIVRELYRISALMRHDDGRKLDHKTLEALRVRAVQRVMDGESPEVVIKALGMSRARIYEWLAAYREGGFEALKAKHISGRPKKLSGEQIRELYTWITTFTPDQLKFNFALWTRGRVRDSPCGPEVVCVN